MYRNFDPASLGISGRPSEVIELALNYGFRGMDLDLDEFARSADDKGFDWAARYLPRRQLKITGGDLPVDLGATETEFTVQLEQLAQRLPYFTQLGVETLYYVVSPSSPQRPYHENFELHRTRLLRVSDLLRPTEICVAIGMNAVQSEREAGAYQFVWQSDALTTLVKTVGADNVGLLLDTWQWHLGGGTIAKLQDFPVSLVATVRMADLPTDFNLLSVTRDDRLMPATTGVVPNSEIWNWLAQGQYQRGITVAPSSAATRGLTRDRTVARSVEALDLVQQGELFKNLNDSALSSASSAAL
ncbi:MAG: TIM barrel protein [Pirellulales bacterium]